VADVVADELMLGSMKRGLVDVAVICLMLCVVMRVFLDP